VIGTVDLLIGLSSDHFAAAIPRAIT